MSDLERKFTEILTRLFAISPRGRTRNALSQWPFRVSDSQNAGTSARCKPSKLNFACLKLSSYTLYPPSCGLHYSEQRPWENDMSYSTSILVRLTTQSFLCLRGHTYQPREPHLPHQGKTPGCAGRSWRRPLKNVVAECDAPIRHMAH